MTGAASPPDPLLSRLNQVPRIAPTDCKIMILWNEGFDTFDIAEMMNVPESQIANRLMHIRRPSTDCLTNGLVHHD
jgi:hypothetical protein